MNPENPSLSSRRNFLKTSGTIVAGTTLAGALPRPGYTSENNTIKIALVGCGGRGTGAAAQALSTEGPTRLWAISDVFDHRLDACLKGLSPKFGSQISVPQERRFIGFDGYKQAIDSLDKGDVVILATPPAFRPLHFEYAVRKGCHVFMEKSFAVDGPGVRGVLQTGELASQKNLKVAGGLMSRHSQPLEEAVDQIHNGIIGDVITAWAYRMHGKVHLSSRTPGMSEMAFQIANYSCFTWLNGSFIVDWLIHNIDVCCWVKNAWPVSAQGMGGRQVRTEPDQLFDHYAAEYSFPDGTRMFAQGRHQDRCYDFFGNIIHGAKGSAVLGEGVPRPRIFKGHTQSSSNLVWDFKGAAKDQYQVEHDLLFEAIRKDRPYNETQRCAYACLTAIMGRMACESGQLISWDEAMASEIELAPRIAEFTLGSIPPAAPDSDGKYEIAMPGKTRVL
jgi:myo-inositol 2-dehydrogenase / D-chiro-inositol 1-dehydrogenase